ncbi:hypothetical protein BN1048_00853 [Jeotgalicoccus saudimassiliensis]|uniref:Lipoprotein n=1 Tax=Jeotgalicoccus saudimassiliensis TaxID=1461582 RepID=A0A078LYK5_9STAP|nr:hypothetical protein [Jeotgalicoccus saudimassiliensis]CEA00178.1 hypothetical protein BN1048_00853 [Jeotgalicoccus saudimassiliensis]
MRKFGFVLIFTLALLVLTGCMYPDNQKKGSSIPPETDIQNVQNAVDNFQESEGGILPIKTTENAAEYMKYPVDFTRIVPGYLSEIPVTAYENGGTYQYIILDAEEDPAVKLADLAIIEELRSLRLRINGMGEHVELGEQVGPNVYQLDLEHYNLAENPTVTSPYSDRELNVYYSGGQEFVVDYRDDLNLIIENEGLEFETGEDIRNILYEYTPVVPIYSPEMTVDENNEAIFMTSVHKS